MSPDLRTLLGSAAPLPSGADPVDDIRRRVRRRRSARFVAAGATSLTVVAAATFLIVTQPGTPPIPDVVDTPPTEAPSPREAPASPSAPGNAEQRNPHVGAEPPLDYVAIRQGRAIVQVTSEGSERILVDQLEEEAFLNGLGLQLHGGEDSLTHSVTGAFLSSAGESDELWMFRASLDGSGPADLEKLPDEFQRRSTGGADEIGWPRPVVSWAPGGGSVVMYVDGQGSGLPGEMNFVNSLHVLSLRPDGTHMITEFPLEDSTGPGSAVALSTCPEYFDDPAAAPGYPLCLLVDWPDGVVQYRLSVLGDGTVEFAGRDTSPFVDGPGMAASATFQFEDGVIRWGVATNADLGGRGNLLLVDLDEDAVFIELVGTAGEAVESLSINGSLAVLVTRQEDLRRTRLVDLATGAIAAMPSLDQRDDTPHLLSTRIPLETRAILNAEWLVQLATDPGQSWTTIRGRPIDAAELALGPTVHRTLDDPRNIDGWTIELPDDEGFEGYVGPFNSLRTIASAARNELTITLRPEGHCASPATRPPPPGMDDLLRVRIERSGLPNSSCLDWFAVDLYLSEFGEILGVALQLWEP